MQDSGGAWPTGKHGLRPSMRVLRWLAIVLPISFFVVVDLVRHTVWNEALHTVPGFFTTHALTALAVVAFSFTVFGIIGRLQTRITRQNRQLTALNEVAIAAAETLRLDDLLGSALGRVLKAMNADAGVVCLVDLESEEHTAVCRQGFTRETAREIQRAKLRDDPIAYRVVRTRRPVVFDQVFEDPKVAAALKREGIKSGISSPLMWGGEVNGILAIASRSDPHLGAADREFLDSVCAQLGMAIRNAVLYERTELHNRDLSALLTVGQAVTSSLELDEVLRSSLDAIIAVTSGQAAEIWLPDDDGGLVLRSQRGAARQAFMTRTRFSAGEGLPGAVARSGKALVVHDLPADNRFVRRAVIEAGFHTYCAQPLQSHGKLIGVLAVAARSPRALIEPRELRLMEGIGERLALAIENARLHAQVHDLAVVQERERIAREMHDGLGQVLGYINTQTLAVKKMISDERLADARVELAKMEEVARELYADVRESILGLRTSPDGNGGLIPALREYVQRYRDMSGIDATVVVAAESECVPLPPAAEIQLMRIVQEALANVRRHARATCAQVCFEQREQQLWAEVADNGRGFDPAQLPYAGRPRFGLQTMRERAESVGGTFAIRTKPGEGTRIVVSMPLVEL